MKQRPGTGFGRPHRAVKIVRRKHRYAARRQRVDDGAVFLGHGFDGGHEFEVLTLGVVDQGHRGLGDGGQGGNFTGMVHAQLDHRQRMVRAQAQHGQRHADLIVEVALSGQKSLWLVGAQDGRHHLGHRGFAVAAGHGHQRQRELCTPVRGQFSQRQFGIGHHEAGQACDSQTRLGIIALADGGHRTFGFGLGQKFIGVETLATQGDKQVTRLQRAGVGVDAGKSHVTLAHQTGMVQPRLGLLQSHHLAGPVRQSTAHVVHIRKREALTGDFLVVLMAFAGNQQDVLGGGLLERLGNGQRPVALDTDR